MYSRQFGWKVIEIVMILVTLGVLAAAAIPRFINHDSTLHQDAVDAVAGALGSASAINYAVRSMNEKSGIPVVVCSDIAKALEGGLDAAYSLSSNSAPGPSCTVIHRSSQLSATFIGHAIP